MTMEDWDKTISPHLQFIESGAAMAARHATALTARPGFETMAEEELDKAFKTLAAALDKIITAQKSYREKPVTA